MRPLTDRDKRAIRIAGIAIAIYLVLFSGFQVVKFFEKRRVDYRRLVREAQNLRREIQPYQAKAAVVKKLMEHSRLDPAKLSRETVVAEASAAIQKSAQGGGLVLGVIRETPARPSSKEMATIQFEGSGPVSAVMSLLGRMDTLGYPLVIDSVQLTPETMRQGQIKLNLTVVVLDFAQWEAPHA